MRRFSILLAVVSLLALGSVGPARADYHGLCNQTPVAQDTHSFTNTGSQLRAGALVQCYGRTITIQKFQVLDVGTQTVVASLPAPLQCTNVCQGTDTQIFAPLASGYYEVLLHFHVSGNSFTNVRQSEYLFTGSGQPTQTCGFRFGPFPVSCV